MTSIIRLSVLVAILAPPSIFAAQCPTATLRTYLDTIPSCEIGDKRFSEFFYVGIGPIAVAAEDITLTPISGLLSGMRIGGPFEVSGLNLISETFIRFDVSTISGAATISGVNLSVDGAFEGLGALSLHEQIRDNDNFLRIYTNQGRASIVDVQLADSVDIIPTSSIRVTKDIFLLSGVLGSARINSFDQTFEQIPLIPEPSTLLLASAAGLLAIPRLLRRQGRRGWNSLPVKAA